MVLLITLDPGHFHAALIQKEMYAQVSKRVAVYAPLGPDLTEHLNRIARFNSRKEKPTSWELDIHASPDFFERMLQDRPGNVVVLSGRNREKMDRIKRSVQAGLNVLADKPWVIASADLAKLEATLDAAERSGLVAYDIMTERYEITSILLKALLHAPEVFGEIAPGSESEPGVYMESVHYLMKLVAGVPNLRPPWFFDIREQGEGLSDVGTHLVDLVQWTLFPDKAPDYRTDIRMLGAERWPTVITKDQFRHVTGERDGDGLDYFCNNRVRYTLRGVHVKLDVLWNWEAAPGAGDTYLAVFRGTKARLEIRQGKSENYRPELYVVPASAALKKKVQDLQTAWPGIAVEERNGEARVTIPDRYRVGHEAHFAQVTRQFFEYLKSPQSVPAWEKAAMLAKYYVSTKGVEMAQTRRTLTPR